MRGGQIKIVSNVCHLLHQRVSHVALALATGWKFITADHENIVILAVIFSMMNTIQPTYVRSLPRRVLLA
jgi:hypothetical protein